MKKIPLKQVLFLGCCYLACLCEGSDVRKDYSGYQAIKTFPDTEEKIKIVESLEESVESWTPVSGRTTTVDLMLSPKQIPLVKSLLDCSGIKYLTTTADLQRAIEVENIDTRGERESMGSCALISGMSWTQYHSYDTINKYMSCLSSSYGRLVTMYTIGYSSEGRALKVLKVGISGDKKKAIWIDGGIHAREWISPASVTFILRELVERSESYASILRNYDIYIMPSMNPDGYEYSRNYDRMWRKTRSRNPGSKCVGTDPNRNWGYKWGGKGASTNPCTETYRGPYPFSEPETAAVRDFILARRNDIDMYLTFHSYGQMFLHPWGYERVDFYGEAELERMGRVGAFGARSMGGGYRVGSAAKVLYPASGGSDDWAKGGAGIKYSYTIELPDTGKYGFILPASQIIKVGPQALSATTAMIQDLLARV